jgi:hypothetical protein
VRVQLFRSLTTSATANGIPDFTSPRWQESHRDAQIRAAILHGVRNGMPSSVNNPRVTLYNVSRIRGSHAELGLD